MTPPSRPPPEGAVPITQALFSVAPQGDDECTRAEARAAFRASFWPPGFVGSPWRTANAFYFRTRAREYVTPADTIFNGASVPFIFVSLAPRTHALYLAATAQHDRHYDRDAPWISRREADEVLWAASIFLGLNWFWAMIIRRAVRSGGWMHYRVPDDAQGSRLWRFAKSAATSVAFTFGLLLIDLPALSTYRARADSVVRGEWAWVER